MQGAKKWPPCSCSIQKQGEYQPNGVIPTPDEAGKQMSLLSPVTLTNRSKKMGQWKGATLKEYKEYIQEELACYSSSMTTNMKRNVKFVKNPW
jgi:hypothetical protein